MSYEKLVEDHAGEMIEKLLVEAAGRDAVEIRFEFDDQEQWSVISRYMDEEDKEISLRLHAGNRYDLYFGYYDDKDEFFEIIRPLTLEEKKIIPERVQKLMGKVLTDEQGMRIPGKLFNA